MIPGRQTLGSIDDALREQQQKAKSVTEHITALGNSLLELKKAELQHLRSLARERVDYVASGKLISSFDDSEQQVLSLLEHRKATALELDREIDALEQTSEALEQQREEQADALDRASTEVDQAEAKTQQRLEADADYQAQRDRASEAERIALHADDKATRSEQEQEEKGRSYQDDPLFMYLWDRHFGTTEYQANSVTRLLDRWVAGLIHYGDARVNYHRLSELPLRLRDHATQSKAQSSTEYEQLKQLDTQARVADGIPSLEAAEAEELKKLDAIDARIEADEQQQQQQLERRDRFAAGNDREYQGVIDFLTSEFSRDDLQQLRRDALATPYPEDDVIVARILDGEQEQQDIEQRCKDNEKLLKQHRTRLKELQSMRADFKRRRYDNPRSGFNDGALVAGVLGNVIGGLLKSDAMWDVLQNQQRPRRGRANPGFGSGGFGRGSMWGRGGGSRSGGGPRSGGGFRTGGGF